MGEMGKFLYGQIVVGSSLIQLFRRPFFAVDERMMSGCGCTCEAVFQLVNGIAVSVDAEALRSGLASFVEKGISSRAGFG